jgi:glycosyltransferase involved in cell wall biosynthesis
MGEFSGLRALYVGESAINGLDKRRALRELGVDLVDFDVSRYTAEGGRLWHSLARRAGVGPVVTRLNRDLVAKARELRDVTHLWVDKGTLLWPDTLGEIRERLSATLVHYSNDSLLIENRSRHFFASVPLYDFHFTTKRFELEGIRKLGAARVHLTFDAVDPTRFRPQGDDGRREALDTDVGFVGRYEVHYARTLERAAEAGGTLRIQGPDWPRYARSHAWARAHVKGDWTDDYPAALRTARICLGLLSKRFPETVTTRSFEIPGCRCFLLAERTDDHRALFEEDVQAVYFSSLDELVDKIRYYLAHDAERERIAAAGRARFERCCYTRINRVREMLEIVTAA